MQFQGTIPPNFNQINHGGPFRMQQQPMRAPSPVGTLGYRPDLYDQPTVSPGRIPTNLNYPITQGRMPTTNNNFIPQPSPFMGQGRQQFIPAGTPQFLPMQYVGQSLGPPSLPQGNFIGHNFGAPIGAPYNMVPARPTYIGYRKLDDSSLINPSVKKQKIDTTIHEQPIFCVICQTEYLYKDKQQHIKKHQRKVPSTNEVIKKLKQYKEQYTGFHTRPIVQPEQYNIQYNPNSFVVQQQTNFLTQKVEPIPQTPRHQFGIGTSDLVGNSNSLNIQPPQQIGTGISVANNNNSLNTQPPVFQPQSVTLPQDGETVTYVDNNQFQLQRTMKSTQHAQPPVINTGSDARFTRNTFISDEPAPVVQPSYGLYGRQTIQSQQFGRPSGFSSLSYASPTPIPVSSTLPPRDTVVSQDFRTSQAPVTNSQYLPVTQKIANNHQSVMSPIRQQSQNRQVNNPQPQTSSQPPYEVYNYEQNPPLQQSGSGVRTVSSQVNSNTNTAFQDNQARSTVYPTANNNISDYEKQSLPAVGSANSKSPAPSNAILDTFNYTNAVVNGVIPRQSRKIIQFDPNTNNITNIDNNLSQSIPIEAIIQDKNSH